MVDPVILQKAHQILELCALRDHGHVGLLAQAGQDSLDRLHVAAVYGVEDVAVGNDLALDRVGRSDCVDLRPGTLQVSDDPAQLIQVV